MLRRLLVLPCALFGSLWANSGYAEPAYSETTTLRTTPRFTRIGLEDGLPQLSAYAITQDEAGFIWIGTGDGLGRFDGREFKVFYEDSDLGDQTVSQSVITALQDDGQGSLWIGTGDRGLNRYAYATERFQSIRHVPDDPKSLSSDVVTALHRDSLGNLWVGTKAGLNRFERSSGRFVRYTHDSFKPKSLGNDSILSISGGDEALWIGTSGGLDRFNVATNTFEHYRNVPGDPNSISNDSVSAVLEDQDGIVWIGTDGGGLNRLDPRTKKIKRYRHNPRRARSLSDDRVRVIFQDSEGTIWVGTRSHLNRLEADGGFTRLVSRVNDVTSLPYPWVASIYEDRGGVLWVGTWGGGVGKLDLRATKVALYKNGSTFAFDEDANGNLWLGEHVGGLVRFNRKNGRMVRFKQSKAEALAVHVVKASRDGTIWAGTFGQGLRQLDPKKKAFTFFPGRPDEPGFLNSDAVFAIHEDPDGALWLGTWGGGVNKLDPESGWFSYYTSAQFDPQSISSNYVYTIKPDRKDDNIMWIGTANGGLNRFNRNAETFEFFRHDPEDPNSLSHNNVLAIHQDKDGILWLGTYGGGLNRFDPKSGQFEHLTVKDGLAHNFVFGILEDSQGFLWLSTNRGLSKLNPKTRTFSNYDSTDGLQGNEFSQGAYFQSPRTKEMFFGGVRGFNVFKPEVLKEDDFLPPAVLTKFQITGVDSQLDNPLSRTERVFLNYDQPLFSLEFAALSFAAPDKNRFQYRLEGLHSDWIETSRTFVNYSSLDPGEYMFRVRAANRHGRYNEEEAKLAIEVAPPPWKTWWAYALYALLVIGFAYLAFRYQERRVEEARRASRLEAVEKDLELASTVQSWFLPQHRQLDSTRFTLYGFFRPADQCSGDWWWHEQLPDGRHWVVVGDVTGHGTGPAVLTASVATALRLQRAAVDRAHAQGQSAIMRLPDIPERLSQVSEQVQAVCNGKYHMTMSTLEIDETNGRIRFVGSGGLPVMCLLADGSIQQFGAPGTPLGTSPFQVGEAEHQMHPGERLFVFTDGIPETQTKTGRALGMRRLQKILESTAGMTPDQAAVVIADQVDEVRDGVQDDDMTFVLIDWHQGAAIDLPS